MIEIRHLHLIQQIAETGNMTRAADKLNLTQPSLSHQLKEIESRLDTQLFLRVNRNLVLTPAGEKLLQAARDILPSIRSVETEIKGLVNGTREIRISTKCYTCYHWLPSLMKKFRQTSPDTVIDIVTEAMTDPVNYLLSGKIDIAILNGKTEEPGIVYEKLFDDEQVLIVPRSHALAKRKYVRAKDFMNEPLIIYKEDLGLDFFYQQVLKPADVMPGKVTKMQLTEARVELVKAGMGITVLSRWLVKPFLQGASSIRQVRINPAGFYRSWYIATLSQKKSDPEIRQFIDYLKSQHYSPN